MNLNFEREVNIGNLPLMQGRRFAVQSSFTDSLNVSSNRRFSEGFFIYCVQFISMGRSFFRKLLDDDSDEDEIIKKLLTGSTSQPSSSNDDISGLKYDFYHETCPQEESIIRTSVARIYSDHSNVSAALLRLFFHDCFVEGCDASVLLDDSNGDKNHSIERQAIPNQTLRGFDKIDSIKEELEKACPGIVSCADIVSIATRDGIMLKRLSNFKGTGQPDPTIAPDFLTEMRMRCQDSNGTTSRPSSSSMASLEMSFDTHYYQSLLNGRGLLFAAQQLMANEKTTRLIRAYALDDGSTFRMDFAQAMMKMSGLNLLTGSQGQVRRNCSLPLVSS
ncbi:hypothetical protein SO802_010724 [Lithocarpus litseifolius]|uniref:Peroxidase n=1 Tax=Lithocarpus litseifolius TaxID=425828 RepID=A0AAW2DFI3_9ROSI